SPPSSPRDGGRWWPARSRPAGRRRGGGRPSFAKPRRAVRGRPGWGWRGGVGAAAADQFPQTLVGPSGAFLEGGVAGAQLLEGGRAAADEPVQLRVGEHRDQVVGGAGVPGGGRRAPGAEG